MLEMEETDMFVHFAKSVPKYNEAHSNLPSSPENDNVALVSLLNSTPS